MATADFFSAARSQAIEDAAVTNGYINGSGHLILVQHDGDEIDAGDALLAVLPASTTQAGIVELATSAQTAAHTDADRAVTPASLAATFARIVALEVGDSVQQITAPAESAGPSSYPDLISVTYVSSGSGWTPEGGAGSIITVNQGGNRCIQFFAKVAGGITNNIANFYIRSYHTPEGWTQWCKVVLFEDTSTMGITGEIRMWAAATAPNGWLLCEGSAISRTTYAALFALIGTNYGAGDGSTTFNVPDFRGRVPAGYDSTQTDFNTRGKTGGEKTHTLTTTEMPSHNHQVGVDTSNGWAGSHPQALTKGASGFVAGTASDRPANSYAASAMLQATGGGGAHNVMQPYMTIKYMIKL